MENKKQTQNWIIDFFILVGFLFTFYLDLTGVILHEWLGVALVILTALHFLLHWDWVVSVTKRFFKKTPARSRWYYIIDGLLALGGVVIVETGLVISTWFKLELYNYTTWLDIHIFSSIATLALTVAKIGLHWKWVVKTTSKVFAINKQAGQPAVVPIRVPVSTASLRNAASMDRRQFLTLMGVVGLGAALASYNVLAEDSAAQAELQSGSGNSTSTTAAQRISSAQVVENIVPTTTNQPVVVETQVDTRATPTAQITLEDSQTVYAVPTTTNCVVRCPNGCSYPGRCRRYTDQNNNRKCDLGECL